MDTEDSALARRVYGRVERETNDTIVFISEKDRRIRFRHVGKSLQYPSAAEYQCTQCPMTALLVNAVFRIVDPCAGHDCSLGVGRPQWTPSVGAAKTVRSRQSPTTSALASRSACPVKPAKKKREKAAAQVAGNASETANVEDEDTDDVTIIKVVGEPSAKIRRRSRAKRTSTLSAEEWEDKAFGKIRTVSSSTLTEAERVALFGTPSITVGRMRGKELIAYPSQMHKRKFKFVLVGASSLDKYAFDYYCLDCWIHHEEECRVTVHSSTLEFIITDPDQTSSGVEAESIRTQKVLYVERRPW